MSSRSDPKALCAEIVDNLGDLPVKVVCQVDGVIRIACGPWDCTLYWGRNSSTWQIGLSDIRKQEISGVLPPATVRDSLSIEDDPVPRFVELMRETCS